MSKHDNLCGASLHTRRWILMAHITWPQGCLEKRDCNASRHGDGSQGVTAEHKGSKAQWLGDTGFVRFKRGRDTMDWSASFRAGSLTQRRGFDMLRHGWWSIA